MYRVGMGETPEAIASRLTGDPRRAVELIRANPQKERIRDGRLTFLGFVPGETIKLPRSWGLGAPPFPLLAGMVYVDAQIALAACQSGWERVSATCAGCPPTLVQQVVKAANAGASDIHYVYYDGALYELNFPGGGRGWVQRRCTQPNKSAIPGVVIPTLPTTPTLPSQPFPTPPPGNKDVKPISYTTGGTGSSSALPIIVAVASLAAGVGLAYLVTRRKEGEEFATTEGEG